MREILFRGKRVDNGEFVYGYIVEWGIDIGTEIFDNGKIHRVEKETVGQFTGLTDKNGVKIFEGDVISFKWNGETREEVIEFRQFSFTVGLDLNFTLNKVYEEDLGDIEVIGNIHTV